MNFGLCNLYIRNRSEITKKQIKPIGGPSEQWGLVPDSGPAADIQHSRHTANVECQMAECMLVWVGAAKERRKGRDIRSRYRSISVSFSPPHPSIPFTSYSFLEAELNFLLLEKLMWLAYSRLHLLVGPGAIWKS